MSVFCWVDEMKMILLLIPSMTQVGGTERMVHALSLLFVEAGYQVHQASFDAPNTPRHFDSAIPWHSLGPIPRLPLPIRPLAYLLSAWRLRQLKRNLGINVTISNLWGADLINALSGGADRKVALCHINVLGNPANRLMVRLRSLVAAVYRRFDRVVAVSAPLAQELGDLYRLAPQRVCHIDNFVERPEAISCLPADGVQRFVWCGRFSPEKNIDGLLHAWAGFARQRKGVQLVLLGDGPLIAPMRQLAERLDLICGDDLNNAGAQVIFRGKVSDPASYMLGAKGMLLSSHAEGLPMVVLEALALGLPVFASDCQAGGVRVALKGQGICDPNRASAEMAPPGYLLPVPRKEVASSLKAWEMALNEACENGASWSQWQTGALGRAQEFGSQSALAKWQRVLSLNGVSS